MTNQEIQNLIKELIEKTTIPVREITFTETNTTDGSGMGMFSVEVNEPHFFIGRGGEGLSALNHLVRRIIETKTTDENFKNSGVLIDINGFQKKRIESIHAIAHMMAERARYFKTNIEVDPMSAFERRIVHEFLSTANDLKTESTGEGLSRRVVIKYIGEELRGLASQ